MADAKEEMPKEKQQRKATKKSNEKRTKKKATKKKATGFAVLFFFPCFTREERGKICR